MAGRTLLYALLLSVFLIPEKGFSVVKHVYFIVNPVSNNGEGRKAWESIQGAVNQYFTAIGSQGQATAQQNPTFEVAFTGHAGHGTTLATEALQNWQNQNHLPGDQLLIVAVGGDGTIHEVVQGLENQQEQVVIGVLPVGTGNDIARSLGLRGRDLMYALRVLVHGVVMSFGAYRIRACNKETCEEQTVLAVDEFDLGIATGATHIKNDHDSGERPSRLMKLTPRAMVYPVASISSSFGWDAPMVRCTIDGGNPFHIPLNIIAGGTGTTIGGGVSLFNGMAPDNPQGTLVFSQGRSSALWVLAQMVIQGLLNWSGLQQQSFTELTIEHESGQQPVDVQIDGDISMQTPAHITWLAGIFRFLRAPRRGEPGYDYMSFEDRMDDLGSL